MTRLRRGFGGQARDAQDSEGQARDAQDSEGQARDAQDFDGQARDAQDFDGQAGVPQGSDGQVRLAAALPELAEQLNLPHATDADLVIERADRRLQVRDTRDGAPGPLWVDFSAPDVQRRIRQGTRLPLARAVGLKRGTDAPSVVDATAGLGRDAYTLAAMGCHVTAIERSDTLAALLADGLERAAPEVAARVSLVVADATEALKDMPPADVVYLDPMFPKDGKSALARKQAQYLQALVQEDDAGALFEAARNTAAKRVVVKRPLHAKPLHPNVNHTLKGKTVRFDVYVKAVERA
jgi:16S rRNA (guanine1516-N2)-methyltransferase